MPKLGGWFEGNYLKAEVLADRRIKYVIVKADLVKVEDRRTGTPKSRINITLAKPNGVVLNQTWLLGPEAGYEIAGQIGSEDTDDWAGAKITLYTKNTPMGLGMRAVIDEKPIGNTAVAAAEPVLPERQVMDDDPFGPSESVGGETEADPFA